MFLDSPVSLVSIAEITAKAANRKIAGAIHRLEFVDVGKLARGHERHSQAIDGRECGAKQGMREADCRALYGLSEVPGRGPVSRVRSGLRRRNCH